MRLRLGKLKLTYAAAIVLVVISLGLFVVQAGVWARATAHARTETVTQNKIGSHRPSETAGLAGMLLLVLTGTALCFESISPPRESEVSARTLASNLLVPTLGF